MRLKEKCEICCLARFAEKYIFWVATGSDPLRSHQLYHLMEIFGEKYILWREREGNFWLNAIDSPQKFSVCFEVREGSENVDLISFLISPPWWSRQVGSWAQLTGAQLSGVQFAENPPRWWWVELYLCDRQSCKLWKVSGLPPSVTSREKQLSVSKFPLSKLLLLLAPTGALYVMEALHMEAPTQLFTFLTQLSLWIASIVSIQLKATLKGGSMGATFYS